MRKTFSSNYFVEGKTVRKYSGRGSVGVGDGTMLLRELRKLERVIHTLRLESTEEIERLKLVAEKALKESKSIKEKSINTQWELDIRRRQEYDARYQNGGWR